jgi:plasmid replication initiation protein
MKKTNNLDLFVNFANDVSGRGKLGQDFMSRSWFNLSKKKRTKGIEHYFGKDKSQYIKIYGSEKTGIANIFDNDVLIYLITQLRAKMDGRTKVGENEILNAGILEFSGYDYLLFRNARMRRKNRRRSNETIENVKSKVSGRDYDELWKSLMRLQNTHCETNVTANGYTFTEAFNFLSSIRKETDSHGRVNGIRVQLCEYLVNRVQETSSLLTFDADEYFSLTSGVEKWIYLFARKACGQQKQWQERIESLYSKSGSTDTLRAFRTRIKKIAAKGKLIDYELECVDDTLIIRKASTYVLGADRTRSKTAKAAVEESRRILGKR